MLKVYLEKLLSGRDLSVRESSELLTELASGDASAYQAGAVLAALRMKGESVSELVGGAEMLRRNAKFIDCGARECVDIVGTGGDGGKSFNISTTAAFIAAGAGVPVAKHGNRAVSGKSGAADMLSALGFNLEVAPERIEECIAEYGIGFMFAPKMHPVMGRVAPLRRELGVRTIFNMLGPLANPAGVKRMVLGVYDARLTELFGAALNQLGVTDALVVHGGDGLDEISCCAATRITELKDGALRSYDLYPELLLGDSYEPEEIVGGTPEENAQIALAVLDGRDHGAPRAISALNAAAGCYVAGLAADMGGALKMAYESIDSGKAREKLDILIRESRR